MVWDSLKLGVGCCCCDYVSANLFTLMPFVFIFDGLLKKFQISNFVFIWCPMYLCAVDVVKASLFFFSFCN